MTLDLARVVAGIDAMIASADPASDRRRFDALRSAWQTLDSREVNARIAGGKPAFLLARTSGDYLARHPLPQVPETYTVAAADGSVIVPDRHSPARFYLLNVGLARLHYGDEPSAQLGSEPDLRFGQDELWLEIGSRRIPVNDTILGVRRATAELEAVYHLLEDADGPAVGLQDGTLILWSLSGLERDEALVETLIRDYLDALLRFRSRRLPVASYISAPGSTELMNVMRIAVCDYPIAGMHVDCDHCRARIWTERRTPACDILPNVTDRYLLEQIAGLEPGQRTEVFESQSKILKHYGPDLSICYVYVNVGREIGRIEMPRWVAEDRELLDLVHAVVHDQCRLGRGYPVALQEAHEQAVLSMGDRRLVEETIERRLASLGIVLTRTGKDGSKRGRFV